MKRIRAPEISVYICVCTRLYTHGYLCRCVLWHVYGSVCLRVFVCCHMYAFFYPCACASACADHVSVCIHIFCIIVYSFVPLYVSIYVQMYVYCVYKRISSVIRSWGTHLGAIETFLWSVLSAVLGVHWFRYHFVGVGLYPVLTGIWQISLCEPAWPANLGSGSAAA